MKQRTEFLGKAGEHMVAAQLLLRGISVAFPSVDEGVDLLAGHLRIQVKSARRIRAGRSKSFGYHFNIGVTKWDRKERTFHRRDIRSAADFYVFWGIDENRFWIVPSSLLAKSNVRIVDGSKRYTVDADAIRALHGTGLTQRQIAKRLGFSEMSVSRVLNGNLPKTEPGSCREVTEREGAWHEIISALGLVNSIDTESKEELISAKR